MDTLNIRRFTTTQKPDGGWEASRLTEEQWKSRQYDPTTRKQIQSFKEKHGG
jgi:hypothetical protein